MKNTLNMNANNSNSQIKALYQQTKRDMLKAYEQSNNSKLLSASAALNALARVCDILAIDVESLNTI